MRRGTGLLLLASITVLLEGATHLTLPECIKNNHAVIRDSDFLHAQ